MLRLQFCQKVCCRGIKKKYPDKR